MACHPPARLLHTFRLFLVTNRLGGTAPCVVYFSNLWRKARSKRLVAGSCFCFVPSIPGEHDGFPLAEPCAASVHGRNFRLPTSLLMLMSLMPLVCLIPFLSVASACALGGTVIRLFSCYAFSLDKIVLEKFDHSCFNMITTLKLGFFSRLLMDLLLLFSNDFPNSYSYSYTIFILKMNMNGRGLSCPCAKTAHLHRRRGRHHCCCRQRGRRKERK